MYLSHVTLTFNRNLQRAQYGHGCLHSPWYKKNLTVIEKVTVCLHVYFLKKIIFTGIPLCWRFYSLSLILWIKELQHVLSQLTWLVDRCANWQCQERTSPSLHPAGAQSTSIHTNVLWLVNYSLEGIAIWFSSTHWSALQQGTGP